jgi:hypothetical protein
LERITFNLRRHIMKVNVKSETIYTLELTEAEATWLRGLMQNKIHEDETEQDQQYRELFWNAICTPAATNPTAPTQPPVNQTLFTGPHPYATYPPYQSK